MKKYIPSDFEKKWQDFWQQNQVYHAEVTDIKPKKYLLDMFPYPSGDGLHVGHVKTYISSDVLARFYRLQNFNVLHPMGWDAFGLNAENYAIRNKTHPKLIIQKSIDNIRRQMQMVGLSYDWEREINTTDQTYYKWTQWIFLKLFEHDLAYEDEAPINWCPQDKTGLANEEVIKGHCERCGSQVERKVIRQWILRITKYADRLAKDVQSLDWPQFIKEMQVNWIGKSEGTMIKFDIEDKGFDLETFTTRIDTIFGVTGLILAPEHEKIKELVTAEHKQKVDAYLKQTQSKSDLERTELNKDKTGVFTGSYAINPVNGEKVPIWVADYVLGFYGTGAVMFVPAHDSRDFEFAHKYQLKINQVIQSNQKDELPLTGEGLLINSGQFNGLSSIEAKKAITQWLKKIDKGDFKVTYKLRDWIFSRQRYWGEPIPIIHCQKCGLVPVPEDQLPVTLPEVENYEPTGNGQSPLAAIDEWVNTTCPKCNCPAKRETNTMPQWAGSCWYYLRFCDPHNDQALISKETDAYWQPVDWYIGGAEHAVLHLLYARFWHKFLFDLGVVKDPEPFLKLSSVGLVSASDGRKMSKSLGNVITPDQIVNEYGTDTLRIYEAFMGPFESAIAWEPSGINGAYKFLNRVWEVITKDHHTGIELEIEVGLNKLIQKVAANIEQIKLNTSVAFMMEFINLAYHCGLTLDQKKRFLIVLGPFAPHISEELWHQLGEKNSIHLQTWPKVDKKYLKQNLLKIAIQINGKVRDTINVSTQDSEEVVKELALKSDKVQKYLAGKNIQKTIYIPGKILSIVIS